MYHLLTRGTANRFNRITCGRRYWTTGSMTVLQPVNDNPLTIRQQNVKSNTIIFVNSIRTFHSTGLTTSLPGRRRNRGVKRVGSRLVAPGHGDHNNNNNDYNNDEENSQRLNVLQHTPVLDVVRFRQAVNDLFEKLERALMPMKAKNDPFLISRLKGEIGEIFKLDLGPKEGFYQIEISEEECVFEYSSPVSGKLLYCLSSRTGEWVGVDDGNAFEGIFVRDLIRQCQGLPDL
jgi:hypothetical protein